MMDATNNNPPLNRLQSGVTPELLESAVRQSGYPLQRVVAEGLAGKFEVTEEWGFVDRVTQEHRSLDVFAHRRISECTQLWLDAALLVECKRSDLPFIFFEAAVPRTPAEFPLVAGLRGRTPELHVTDVGSTTASVARFLGLHEFPFVSAGPPTCSSFTKSERKSKDLRLSGTVPFNQVIMPLASAVEHFMSIQKQIGSQTTVPVCLTHQICVLDGSMVLVRGGTDAPQLTLCPWVRVVRQEVAVERQHGFWRHYVVDFVHRAYISTFVDDHFLPFAQQFAERAASVEGILAATKARVPDLKEWDFKDLQPYSQTG